MTIPSFALSPRSQSCANSVTVIGLIGEGDSQLLVADSEFEALLPLVKSVDASSSADSMSRIPHPTVPGTSVAVLGLGKTKTIESLRAAAGTATRKLRKAESIEFAFGDLSQPELVAVLEGALLGAYAFDRYKSDFDDDASTRLTNVTLRTSTNISNEDTDLVREKVAAIALVKDLVNMTPSDLTPEVLANIARTSCEGLDIHVTTWTEKQLEADGLGGILGVGRGSINPPRLVKLTYKPAEATRHIALVGKGITFDTGGLTLKSASGMVGMKYDMTGAATVLAVIRALAAIKATTAVTAWMCIAENMPSGSATKPNDVLRIRNGKTVEVLNTDAEGRLVLADGLSLASEEHPDLIIDIATLTGAARGALGTRTVAAMGYTDDVSRLVESASFSGERFWRLPLTDELRPMLKSEVADMINAKPGNTVAGTALAGVFLSEFVGNAKDSGEQIPWIHLDIAGTADNPGPAYGFTGAGPTGVTVRALIDFILDGA